MASTVNFGSQQYFGFDPRTIPGCQLWLDAADSNAISFSSGSNISTWRDKSGNGLNFTTTTGTPTYTSNTVTIPSGAIMTSSSSISLTTDTYIFVVSKLTGLSGGYGMMIAFSSINPSGNVGDFSIRFSSAGLFGTPPNVGTTNDFANAQYYVNGSFNPSTVSYSTYLSTNIISGQSIASGTTAMTISTSFLSRFFIGNVYEIIMYSSVPSTNVRLQIEGYLKWKWPLSPVILTTPLSIPGCQLWLDATDPAANGILPSNGSTLTSWVDKSGNSRNLSVGSGTTTWNANSVRLSSSYMSVTSAVNLSSVSFFIVTASPTAVANQTVFIGRPNTVADWNSTDGFGFYIDNNNGSRVYGQGGGGQSTSFANTGSTSMFMTSAVFSNTGSFSSWRNGGTQANATTSARTTTAQGFAIGGNWTGTSYANIISSAYIYEIVVYNTTLSITDRQAVERYLANKWGITVPTSSTTMPIPMIMRIFQPNDISNCQLWLDAADSSTITISTGVSQWNDKSGNGFNATQITVGNRPTYDSTNRRVNFARASSQFLNLPDNALPSGNSSYSYLIVLSFASFTNGLGIIGGGSYGTTAGVFALRSIGTTGGVHQYWWAADLQVASGVYSVNTPLLIQTRYAAGGTRATLKNGTQLASDTPGTRVQGISNNRIGLTYTVDGEYMDGYINEIVVFSKDLTTSERQQVEGYLAAKWGLSSQLPTTQPYYLQRALPSTPLFVPTSLSNCQLWLDAADSATVTGTSPVTAWNDKSGNGRNLTVGSGTTTYVSNSVRLNTSYMFVTSAVNLTEVSYFIVAVSPNAVFNQSVFAGRPNTTPSYSSLDGFSFIVDADRNLVRYFGDGTFAAGNSLALTLSPTSQFMVCFTGASDGSIAVWQNGSVGGSGKMTAARTSTAQGFALGADWSGTGYTNVVSSAYIYEVIVYNTNLTTFQRQQVEGYLAWKWGLQTKLPITHPYYKFRP